MDVAEGMLGRFPCLIAGDGEPVVMLAGLGPDAGVAAGPMRRTHEQTLRPYATGRRVHYVNRRPGLPRGLTMGALAAEHAEAIRATFDGPVDVIGASTGGSIAQQLAADHPDAIRRLVLLSTACRLGPAGRDLQRRAAVRVRAGDRRGALAIMAAAVVPPWRGRAAAAALAWTLGPRLLRGAGDLQDMATTIEAEDAFDLATCPPIRAKTLLVGGARDRFYDPSLFEATAAMIPDCVLSVHPRRGHITVMASARCVAEVTHFLAFRAPHEAPPAPA